MATFDASVGRPFRNPESYQSERITRDMIEPFLRQRGFSDIEDKRVRYGMNESQLVTAIDPQGGAVKLRAQLCWRRDGRNTNEKNYSATQLLSKIKDGDWEGTIQAKVDRDKSHGITHSLFVQREGARIVYAALVPLSAVLPIWREQRRVSQQLIDSGALGRRSKNHAANGHSPTLWLQDDRKPEAHAVADVLWGYEGVVDLTKLIAAVAKDTSAVDDTFDDCPMDYDQIGTDGTARVTVVRSMVKRDRRVRAEVLKRAAGACERDNCEEARAFAGFLDVHHILGVERGDRVWNCVALCPNCHREAHFAPDHDAINGELLAYASTFRTAEVG